MTHFMASHSDELRHEHLLTIVVEGGETCVVDDLATRLKSMVGELCSKERHILTRAVTRPSAIQRWYTFTVDVSSMASYK